MDDLMTGINVPSGTGGLGGDQPRHSVLSSQGVYDPTGGAPASAPKSTSDDILSALDQVNNAFGHLGEKTSETAQPAAQSAPQSTGYGAQQNGYGQQSAPQSTGYGGQQNSYGQQSAPQSTGYGAQQNSYGQQSAPQSTGYGAQQNGYGQQSAPQPAKVNDMGYSSDDYKYDPLRSNYGQRSTSYGNTSSAQQQGGYGQQSGGYGSQQSGYGNQAAGYGTNQSGYSSDDYKYNPYKNYNSSESMVTRAVSNSDTEFMAAVKGGIGAIIGAIPGMLLMIMVARFGFIAAICGAAMAFCIFFGYRLMTRNSWVSTKVGIIICAVVMVLAVYFSVKISWTLAIQDAVEEAASAMRSLLGSEYSGETSAFIKEVVGGNGEITFGNCWDNFGNILDMLNMNGRYLGSLAENYVFAAIGGIGTFMKFGRDN
ncbi:MAG: hypothetical protein IKN66_02760 [Ruminococcus sp.]|nr:hypothetical protein [Ruminococcus sp.]